MYDKYYEINKNFQSSVNLELDLDNESKIYEYVPTNDICDVLKKYIKSVLGKTKERATTLVGPYGKGKSFLLLVLSYILSKNKDTKCWNDLADRIKKIDPELFGLMYELKEKKISLLTVIINSNYENLDQSFMLALSDSLKKENMESVVPKNAFSVALDTIASWGKDKELSKDLKTYCLDKSGSSLDEIIRGLKEYSKEYYDKFCDIYYCITRGVRFNPFINGDIVKIYSDVAYQSHSFGYSGLFVIFDEFSKFIESTTSDVSRGLKLIQDLAEKCTRTGKTDQLHLCCVTHKNLSLYKNGGKDSFKAVEGRFNEVRFNRSLEENYQIISAAIIKKADSKKIVKDYLSDNANYYKKIDELGIFDNSNTLYSEIFPLNPLTSYALIQLSELVAQNERTLYTFLSDTDVNSFNFFIHNNDLKDGLFNVDKVYDYFSELLQKEETNFIRNLWYRAESISSKLDNSLDKRIIKALAIILMINDYDKLPPKEEVVSLCLHEPIDKVVEIVNKLIETHHLRKNILNNLLSFALSNTKHIDDKIAVLSKTKFKSFDESLACNTLNEKKYIIPRKHNEERKITRFFKVIYITEKEFNGLANFDIFFEKNYCDGIVLNLLRHSMATDQIKEKVSSVNNKRVVVCYPNAKIDPVLHEELLRYVCLNDIKSESALDDISREEINLLIEETSEDIRVLFGTYFEKDVSFFNPLFEDKSLSVLLSKILDSYYSKELIFNNELVNKRELSKQYQKAVNNVIDDMLNATEINFNPTSPEASVQRSIIERNADKREFREVIDAIKNDILSVEDGRCNFLKLFGYLEQAPYGIRRGVLPVLIAKAISELSNDKNDILIYYEKKEIVLNAENLVKAIGKDTYYISSSKGSSEQKDYLDTLLKVFKVSTSNSSRIDTVILANSIRKFFMGQPSIVRACKTADFLQLGKPIIDAKNIFLEISLNPHEAIFVKPFKILETKSYNKVISFFKNLQDAMDGAVLQYKANLINAVKETFEIEKMSSLKTGLATFMNKYVGESEKLILLDEDRSIEEAITTKTNYDDHQTINELARACIGSYIEDWEKDNSEQFISRLIKFKLSIAGADKLDLSEKGINKMLKEDDLQLDGIALLLSNSVESTIEEFADSVTNADKVKILTKILKKYL